MPATDQLVLVHGAYRTGNLLIDDDRVSAVLDWETEVIGDPMYDVAYVLSELNREGTDLLSNLVERDEFRRRYEAGTGIEIDDAALRLLPAALRDALGGVLDERHRALRQRRQRRPAPGPHGVVDPRRARQRGAGAGVLRWPRSRFGPTTTASTRRR